MKIKIILLLMLLSIFTYSFQNTKTADSTAVMHSEMGVMTYSVENGQIGCRSEMDQVGKVVALLESLKSNSKIAIESINSTKEGYVINVIMVVEQDSEIPHIKTYHPINYVINPENVGSISLVGEKVYTRDFFEVLISEGSEYIPQPPENKL